MRTLDHAILGPPHHSGLGGHWVGEGPSPVPALCAATPSPSGHSSLGAQAGLQLIQLLVIDVLVVHVLIEERRILRRQPRARAVAVGRPRSACTPMSSETALSPDQTSHNDHRILTGHAPPTSCPGCRAMQSTPAYDTIMHHPDMPY